MLGNVYEWVWDWYASYKSGSATNPRGLSKGSRRVFRGGGWDYSARNCRAAYRSFTGPGYRYDRLGFRSARSRP